MAGAALFGPALLSLSLLVLLASGAVAPVDVPALAIVAASALVAGGLLATSLGTQLLGPFAAPLRLLAPLALALVALAKTGGPGSDLFPLLVVLVAAETAISREGDRFLLVGTYAGFALLVFLFHGVGGEHNLNVSLEAHSRLLHYLREKENEVWVAPVIEVAKYVRSVRDRRR